jgi:hypothetical protein
VLGAIGLTTYVTKSKSCVCSASRDLSAHDWEEKVLCSGYCCGCKLPRSFFGERVMRAKQRLTGDAFHSFHSVEGSIGHLDQGATIPSCM